MCSKGGVVVVVMVVMVMFVCCCCGEKSEIGLIYSRAVAWTMGTESYSLHSPLAMLIVFN
jgi:hypothetical protein